MDLIAASGHQLEQLLGIQTPSPESHCNVDWPNPNNSQLWIKRDDLLHPIISGNKWRKLKYALTQAQQQKTQHLLSFGGGYSNHLHALGYCCHVLGIHFSAIIRGHYQQHLTPMLHDLKQWQTDLCFVDKQTYQQRDDQGYLQQLQQRYPQAVIIPEGGSQQSALLGVAEIIQELQQSYDYILLPVASGGTLAGLIDVVPATQLIGVAVLKGQGYLESLVQQLLPPTDTNPWQLIHDFHHGGYAKCTPELSAFCSAFTASTGIAIEPVYSGKLFYALKQLFAQGYFPKNSKVLALHTGGLQAQRSHPKNNNESILCSG